MHIFTDIRSVQLRQGPIALTIGNFDGIHRGHQKLIEATLHWAKEIQGYSGLLTFEPHPLKVLHPDRDIRKLMSLSSTDKILQNLGLDFLIRQNFSLSFSRLTPQEFIVDWLWNQLHFQVLVVGYDFAFGADRQGQIETLAQLSKELGFKLLVEPALQEDGETLSSRKIRQFLQEGQIEKANQWLGRCYFIEGEVVHGQGRGHTLGLPTANLSSKNEIIPASGVYITRIFYKNKFYNSVTNVGRHPTFATDLAIHVESHIFDFQHNIYGEDIEVHFLKRIRDEIKFESAASLVEQIHKDILTAKNYFHGARDV